MTSVGAYAAPNTLKLGKRRRIYANVRTFILVPAFIQVLIPQYGTRDNRASRIKSSMLSSLDRCRCGDRNTGTIPGFGKGISEPTARRCHQRCFKKGDSASRRAVLEPPPARTTRNEREVNGLPARVLLRERPRRFLAHSPIWGRCLAQN